MSTSVPPASWKATSCAAASSGVGLDAPRHRAECEVAHLQAAAAHSALFHAATLPARRVRTAAARPLWLRGEARTEPRLLAGRRTTLQLAQEADRLGYSVAWAAEAYGSDAVTVLTWIAAQTEHIDVGSAILQIPARTPTMTAMTAATLDTLSGGRFRLGLGLSGPQVSEGWHGVPFAKPLARTREYVDIVKLALSRERVRYDGQTYTLPLPDGPGKALHLMVHPVREHIPIYLASIGPKNLELTGEIADGWLSVFFAPKFAGELLEPSRGRPGEGRQDAGRLRRRRHRPARRRRRRRGVRRHRAALRRALHRRHGQPRAELLQRARRADGLRRRGRRRCRTGTSPATTTAPRRPSRSSSSTRPSLLGPVDADRRADGRLRRGRRHHAGDRRRSAGRPTDEDARRLDAADRRGEALAAVRRSRPHDTSSRRSSSASCRD